MDADAKKRPSGRADIGSMPQCDMQSARFPRVRACVEEHAMSQKLNSAIAMIEIHLDQNSFHLVQDD